MTAETKTESSRQDSETTLSQPTDSCWCGGIGGSGRRFFWREDEEPLETFEKYCQCEAGREAITEKVTAQDIEHDKRLRKTFERRWHNAQIPKRFEDWRLGSSPLQPLASRLAYPTDYESDDQENIDKWVEAYNAWEGSWFVWGKYGGGKTGLAVGYGAEWLRHKFDDYSEPETLLFRSVPDLLSELRSAYRDDGPNEMDLLKSYAEVGLLILDDIGAEQVTGSGWLQDRLYQIIGKRHAELKPIFFTSNLSLPQLSERIGERLTWRIVEMCGESHIVEVKGRNQRDVKGKSNA